MERFDLICQSNNTEQQPGKLNKNAASFVPRIVKSSAAHSGVGRDGGGGLGLCGIIRILRFFPFMIFTRCYFVFFSVDSH